jgi:hypothetical protein
MTERVDVYVDIHCFNVTLTRKLSNGTMKIDKYEMCSGDQMLLNFKDIHDNCVMGKCHTCAINGWQSPPKDFTIEEKRAMK